ncbi:MAG: hypothetical protein AAF702_37915 [Chloroflexota bacterium]
MNNKIRATLLVALAAVMLLTTAYGPEVQEVAAFGCPWWWPPCQN